MTNSNTNNVFALKQLDLAVKRHEEGDFFGALNVLHSVLKQNPTYEAYRETAKVYMDLDLTRIALGYWFRFLDACPANCRAEAYNALGACFYLLDNFRLAGYYYDLQLSIAPDAEFDYLDEKIDYFETITDSEEPEFYVCYPPKKMPSDKRIELAEKNLYLTEDKEAIKLLQSIRKNDINYVGAQLRIAAYYAIGGNVNKAKNIINGLIEDFPGDTLPPINMFVLLADTGDFKGAEKAYDDLKEYDLKTFEECFKVATSCMNVNRDDWAMEYVKKALDDYPYAVGGLFLAGAASYNLGNKKDAERYFTSAYQITDYSVIKYYIDRCREDKPTLKRIGYEMRYPDKIVKKLIERTVSLVNEPPKKITAKNREKILEIIDFVYSFPNNLHESVALALMDLPDGEIRNALIDLLMINEIEEKVKYAIVYKLLMNNVERQISAVYSGLYFNFKLIPVWSMDAQGPASVVKKAHAYAFSRMSAFYKTDFEKLTKVAKETLTALTENGNLEKVEDVHALGASLMILSDSIYSKDLNFLVNYFSTKKTKVNQTLKLIRCKNEDR